MYLVLDFGPLRLIDRFDVRVSNVVNQCLKVTHCYPVTLGSEVALQCVKPRELSSNYHG